MCSFYCSCQCRALLFIIGLDVILIVVVMNSLVVIVDVWNDICIVLVLRVDTVVCGLAVVIVAALLPLMSCRLRHG